MGKSRENLVAYSVCSNGKVIYVGQGSMSHALEHLFPSRYAKFGLRRKPIVRIEAARLTREEALLIEADLIATFRPTKNRARYSSLGGLRAWNSGLRGDPRSRGGRPPGIPMSLKVRKKLSEAMKELATKWMRGRRPWNKGLTAADPRVARGIASYTLEKRKAAAETTWKVRRGLIAAALVAVAPATWDYVGEGRAPATLADCPAGAVATVSYSSGGRPVAAWRRFCYFGRNRWILNSRT